MSSWLSPARVQRAIALRAEGKAWTVIADEIGSTAETIRSAVAKQPDVPAELLRPLRPLNDRVTGIGHLYENGTSREEIQKLTRLTARQVKHAISAYRNRKALETHKLSGRPQPAWLSPERLQRAVQLRMAGATWFTVASDAQCSVSAVRNGVAKATGAANNKISERAYPTRELVQRVGDMLDRGKSRAEIKIATGLTSSQVRSMANRHKHREKATIRLTRDLITLVGDMLARGAPRAEIREATKLTSAQIRAAAHKYRKSHALAEG